MYHWHFGGVQRTADGILVMPQVHDNSASGWGCERAMISRVQDAIAEIHQYGTQGYRWVLDADIEACLDALSHCAFR